jgi:hypothetical protein
MRVRAVGLVPASVAALVLFAGACDVTIRSTPPSPSPSSEPPAASPTPRPAGRVGPRSASEALAALCRVPLARPPKEAEPSGPTPSAITEVERQTSSVRGLRFLHPVPIEAVTPEEIDRRLASSIERSLPGEAIERRTRAWQVIGVIPATVSIREAIERFATGQVIGFYAPQTGRLVFTGTKDPDGLERFTLSHELTHALDDQHFHLERTERMSAHCHDEAASAAAGAIEGSATFFSLAYAREHLSLSDLGSLLGGLAEVPSTTGVPPFIVAIETWPYTAGQAFTAARDASGGTEAVNESLRHLPSTTEQILHPEAYPQDRPTTVDIPDYGPVLGAGWADLDVMEAGEAWLSAMLALRLDQGTATAAAAGWDGGIYRAWSHEDRTAVVLETAWDSEEDAAEFAAAMGRWIAGGGRPGFSVATGSTVTTAFATDERALTLLRGATA